MIEEKMQDDLISRTEAIRIASGYCHPANIADELRKLPPAQSKIIYCKDCIFYDMDMGECDHKFGLMVANDDSFCSLAERRSE